MKKQSSSVKAIFTAVMGLVCLMTMSIVVTHASSRVNNYVYRNHFKPARITYQVETKLPHRAYRHGIGRPEGVVVHETANPHSNIYGEINFMKHDYQKAFVDAYVDNHHIITVADPNYTCKGCFMPGNARFVQFEQIEVHNKRAFAKEVNNAAYFTAYLLKAYKLPLKDAAYTGKGTVWSHAAVSKYLGTTNHTDPVAYYRNSGRRWFGEAYSMAQLYQLIHHYYYDSKIVAKPYPIKRYQRAKNKRSHSKREVKHRRQAKRNRTKRDACKNKNHHRK